MPYNKNSSIFQQMEEFFLAYTQSIFDFWVWAGIFLYLYPNRLWFLGMDEHFFLLYPIHFQLLGMGGHFFLLYPNHFQSSPNLCVNSSSSYVSPSMLLLSSGDLIVWSLACHSTLSYRKFCDRHSNHYDHPEEPHQSVE